MIKGYRTQTDKNYIMNDEVYEKVLLNNSDNNAIYRMERIIETSRYFSSFFVLIVFLIVSFCGVTENTIIGSYLFAATLGGFYMSLSIKIMNLEIIKSIVTIFGILHKFFITYIIVALFSIFYLHNWVSFIIYIFITVISSMFSPRYEKKLLFNTKAAEYVIRN